MCSDWLISKSVLRALNPIEEKNAWNGAEFSRFLDSVDDGVANCGRRCPS